MKIASVIVLSFLRLVVSYRILAVVPTPTFSHQTAFRPIWINLVSRGHDLVLLTTDPIEDVKSENLTQISLKSVYSIKTKYKDTLHEIRNNPLKFLQAWSQFIEETLIHELQLPEVQALLQDQNQKFDLVLTEIFFPASYAFSDRFSCPLIGIVSTDVPNVFHSWIGNPVNPVVFPDLMLPFYKNLTFGERFLSIVYHIFMGVYRHLNLERDQRILENYFGNASLSVYDLKEKMSMLFVNTNPLLHGNRALGPNTISFNGGPREKYQRKELPRHIEEFLNTSSIYFSLGSNINSKDLRIETKTIILEAFRELPYKILWKYEEELDDLPSNVKTTKWISQIDVLNHFNVKLFISHGGLISVEESIASKTPLLLLPLYADQKGNAAKIVDKGFGLQLDHSYLTKEDFKGAIEEMMKNKKFYNNIEKISLLYEDQPMSGVDQAVWWTEYVIRHNGAKHLRSPYLDVPVYQQLWLDVIGVVICTIFVVFIAIRRVARRFLSQSKKKKD